MDAGFETTLKVSYCSTNSCNNFTENFTSLLHCQATYFLDEVIDDIEEMFQSCANQFDIVNQP